MSQIPEIQRPSKAEKMIDQLLASDTDNLSTEEIIDLMNTIALLSFHTQSEFSQRICMKLQDRRFVKLDQTVATYKSRTQMLTTGGEGFLQIASGLLGRKDLEGVASATSVFNRDIIGNRRQGNTTLSQSLGEMARSELENERQQKQKGAQQRQETQRKMQEVDEKRHQALKDLLR